MTELMTVEDFRASPAPWSIDTEWIDFIRDANGEMIIHGDREGGISASTNDLRLILSAPELRKALMDIYRHEHPDTATLQRIARDAIQAPNKRAL